ncbi:MAG: response regulator [Rubrivivax sp.]|nr:response regulator [Rubrivivax sp.]
MASRILVIEDNPVNLELMCCLLQAWQHEVLVARNGEEGLAMARSQRPDLVICDIQMPVLDGYAVARRLRADPALHDLPLVAVTAYAMVGDDEKALLAGFDVHVSKPIDPAGFMAAIEPLLPGGAGSPSPAQAVIEEAPTTIPPELQAPRRPCVVLTVDDGLRNIEYKRDLLTAAGYELLAAGGVTEALDLLARQPVDLVLSDVVMAEGGGHELLRRLRADPAHARLPFVFLTSSRRDGRSRATGLALGADDYLVRPLAALELLAHLRRVVERGRSAEGGAGPEG